MTKLLLSVLAVALWSCKLIDPSSLSDDTPGGSAAYDSRQGVGDAIITYDVSGAAGRDGRDGTDYSGTTAVGSGADGRDGGDATPSQAGEAAGKVQLDLRFVNGPANGVVKLTGVLAQPASRGGDSLPVQQNIDLKVNSGYVYVAMRGGAGGDGGDAGGGQDGAKGYSGSDATRYTWGTDGGRGGDGGDAGNPTDGSAGGKGGDLTLKVPAQQTGLVMLIKVDALGGEQGAAGRDASGGRGGAGGDGGSSYSWSEHHSESYTKSDGSTGTRTRTTYHSNPGGSDGSRGSRGSSSSYSASAGQVGANGTYAVEVMNSDGSSKVFKTPFNLKLEQFDVLSENADKIYEPGEQLIIQNMVIRNTGGMPTPANFELRVYLESQGFVIADGMNLVVPQSIPPGGTYTFRGEKNELTARVKDTTINKAGERFSVSQRISPLAELEISQGVSRPFREFPMYSEFEVTFPIEMTPIESLYSLAPGTATKMRWRIKNISNRDYGRDELERAIRTRLNLAEGTEIGQGQIMFLDQAGSPVRLGETEFLKEVMSLKAGESTIVEGALGLLPNTDIESYQAAVLRSSADLERSETDPNPNRVRPVQHREFTIRAAQEYRGLRDSKFVLVVNSATTKQEIDAHRQELELLSGKEVDIYDLSYYGKLSLAEKFHLGDPLFKDWQGKTLILLNNNFDSAAGRTRAAEQFSAQQLLKACTDRGIGVFIVGNTGEGGQSILGDALIPTHDVSYSSIQEFGNMGEFMRAMKEYKNFVRHDGEEGRNPFSSLVSEMFAEFEVNSWVFWGKPKEAYLRRQAENLGRKLDIMFPEQRYVTVSHFEPEDRGKGFLGLTRRWQWGKIQVRRSLDTAAGSVCALTMNDEQVHHPDTVRSKIFRTGLFLAMGTEQELDILTYIMSRGKLPGEKESTGNKERAKAIADALLESIMTDLANEQAALRNTTMRGGLSMEEIRVRMPKMRMVVESISKADFRSDIGQEIAIELIARINHMSRSAVSWYEYLIPVGRSKRVRKAALQMSSELVENIFGPRPGWLRFGVDNQREARVRNDADARIIMRESELTANAEVIYDGPQRKDEIAFDPEFANPSSRNLTAAEHAAVTEREAAREQARAEFEAASEEAKKELLCPSAAKIMDAYAPSRR